MAGMTDDKLKIFFCKGEYFRLKPPKNKLIKDFNLSCSTT